MDVRRRLGLGLGALHRMAMPHRADKRLSRLIYIATKPYRRIDAAMSGRGDAVRVPRLFDVLFLDASLLTGGGEELVYRAILDFAGSSDPTDDPSAGAV
jgi:hypothetical protein